MFPFYLPTVAHLHAVLESGGLWLGLYTVCVCACDSGPFLSLSLGTKLLTVNIVKSPAKKYDTPMLTQAPHSPLETHVSNPKAPSSGPSIARGARAGGNWSAAARAEKKKSCFNFGMIGIHLKQCLKNIILLKSTTRWSRNKWTLSLFCVLPQNILQLSKHSHTTIGERKLEFSFLHCGLYIEFCQRMHSPRLKLETFAFSTKLCSRQYTNGYFNQFKCTQNKFKVPQGQNEITLV